MSVIESVRILIFKVYHCLHSLPVALASEADLSSVEFGTTRECDGEIIPLVQHSELNPA